MVVHSKLVTLSVNAIPDQNSICKIGVVVLLTAVTTNSNIRILNFGQVSSFWKTNNKVTSTHVETVSCLQKKDI